MQHTFFKGHTLARAVLTNLSTSQHAHGTSGQYLHNVPAPRGYILRVEAACLGALATLALAHSPKAGNLSTLVRKP